MKESHIIHQDIGVEMDFARNYEVSQGIAAASGGRDCTDIQLSISNANDQSLALM